MGWMGKKSEECMNTMNRGHVNMSSEWYVGTTNRRHVGGNTEGVWITKGARSMQVGVWGMHV